MNAITALQYELRKVQQAQAECVTEAGHVKSGCRYRYQILVEKAKELKGSLDWMKKLSS